MTALPDSSTLCSRPKNAATRWTSIRWYDDIWGNLCRSWLKQTLNLSTRNIHTTSHFSHLIHLHFHSPSSPSPPKSFLLSFFFSQSPFSDFKSSFSSNLHLPLPLFHLFSSLTQTAFVINVLSVSAWQQIQFTSSTSSITDSLSHTHCAVNEAGCSAKVKRLNWQYLWQSLYRCKKAW